MKQAVVQIPAYNEADKLPNTAREILDQRVPDNYGVDLQAWVTRSENEKGCCDTMMAAESVPEMEVFEAPVGKLSARNAAHSHAVTRGYDVIVSWDADAPPEHDGVLAALLSAFDDPDVVAANSIPTALNRHRSLLGIGIDLFGAFEEVAFPHINGQAHAFTADAWEAVGPFDDSIDQTEMVKVRGEEEFGFGRKLRQYGKVVQPPSAKVYDDPRRIHCRFPIGERPPYCDTLGIADNYGDDDE